MSMQENSTQTHGGHSGFVSERTKPAQVRIQLPLVDTCTQTDEVGVLLTSSFLKCDLPLSSDIDQITGPSLSLNGKSQLAEYQTLVKDMSSSVRDCKDTPLQGNGDSNHRRIKSEISSYVVALRPWSFPASITPVALGSCLAYKSQGVFDVYIFFTTIFTALCVHAAGNLVNTYFDYVRGIDTKKSDDRTIVDNILSPNDVASLGAVFYIAGCAGFMFLNFLSPAKMEHLALIYFCGLSSSFLYTGGLGLKYFAMGDILIVLTFGPLTVVFSHLSQTGQLSLTPLMYAIPLALNTEAILHCNNARDMETDKQAGIITLAILLGESGSYFLFCLLLFLPYLMFITVSIHYCACMFLPTASIVIAFRLEKQFRRRDLLTLPQKMAHLNLLLGLLYIVSIFLSDFTLLPTMTIL